MNFRKIHWLSIRINAYSIDKFSQKAVVDAITGVIPFAGTTPVNIYNPLMNLMIKMRCW